jgi:alkylhydroperoxidase/carboxymuconolactone decarboxylase family protein YurZ
MTARRPADEAPAASTRKAKAAGATKEEIAEALGVAIALNAGAAYTYALHVLDAVGD